MQLHNLSPSKKKVHLKLRH